MNFNLFQNIILHSLFIFISCLIGTLYFEYIYIYIYIYIYPKRNIKFILTSIISKIPMEKFIYLKVLTILHNIYISSAISR